jgi:5-methylcytosine-specific restriction endonuclease McrA
MKKIAKPTFSVSEVLLDCIDNLQDAVLKQEIIDSANQFTIAETDFNSKKLTNTLYQIQQNVNISETINTTVLKGIYTDRLVNKTNNGRKYYNSIFISAPNGKCPFCNVKQVRTLDHYLPKSKYPILSITPNNLVPSCSDCNKDKLVDSPTNSEEETLHPYFDDIEDADWLKAKIITLNPIKFEYYISPPDDWPDLLKVRLLNHFSSYLLNELYSIHAIEEFENIKQQITKLFENAGSNQLKEHLEDCYNSRYVVNKNSWQTAFYDCLYKNVDFCNGEFI